MPFISSRKLWLCILWCIFTSWYLLCRVCC